MYKVAKMQPAEIAEFMVEGLDGICDYCKYKGTPCNNKCYDNICETIGDEEES